VRTLRPRVHVADGKRAARNVRLIHVRRVQQPVVQQRALARRQLKIHKSEVFFDALGDSLQFESRTNVNDLVVVLVAPK